MTLIWEDLGLPGVVDVHVHVAVHEDIAADINIVMHFDGSLDHMRVNVTYASVVDAFNDDGTALHW